MKFYSRPWIVISWNFCENKLGYLNPSLEKLGVTHDLGWWFLGKSMVDFIFALIELFRYLLRFRVITRNVYSLAVFAGGWPLCSQILPGQGRPPVTTLGIRKLETPGYPLVKTASLCVPSFWLNTELWRQSEWQTGGQTDGRADLP